MANPSVTMADSLLEEKAPHSAGCGWKALVPLSLFAGLGFTMLLSNNNVNEASPTALLGTTMSRTNLGPRTMLRTVPAASQWASYRPEFRVQAMQEPSYDEITANCGCPVDTVDTPAVSEAMSLFERAQVVATDASIEGGKVAAAMSMAALLVAAQPALADTAGAAKDLTDAAYPIIGALKKDAVGPITSKGVQAVLVADPKQIIKLVDTGLDAFLATPPEKFLTTVKALKVATSEANAAKSCNLICTPSLETAETVGAAAVDALSSTPKDKLTAFTNQLTATINSSPNKDAFAGDLQKFVSGLDPGAMMKVNAALDDLKGGR